MGKRSRRRRTLLGRAAGRRRPLLPWLCVLSLGRPADDLSSLAAAPLLPPLLVAAGWDTNTMEGSSGLAGPENSRLVAHVSLISFIFFFSFYFSIKPVNLLVMCFFFPNILLLSISYGLR
jgi:hypothetical protein